MGNQSESREGSAQAMLGHNGQKVPCWGTGTNTHQVPRRFVTSRGTACAVYPAAAQPARAGAAGAVRPLPGARPSVPERNWILMGRPYSLMPFSRLSPYGTDSSCLKLTKANCLGRPSRSLGIFTFTTGPACEGTGRLNPRNFVLPRPP